MMKQLDLDKHYKQQHHLKQLKFINNISLLAWGFVVASGVTMHVFPELEPDLETAWRGFVAVALMFSIMSNVYRYHAGINLDK